MRKNKLRMIQLGIMMLFLLFLIFLLIPKNYSKKYKISNIEITEEYKNKKYYFTFKKDDITLDYLINSKYSNNRTLISNIKIIEDDNNNFCLIPTGKIKINPLCYDNNEVTLYYLVNDNLKKDLNEYIKKDEKLLESWNSYDIYNNNYTYLLWKYDGFYYINKNTKKDINIFNNEQYSISTLGYTEDYLVIPDYNSEYTFNNYYIIDFKNGTLKKKKLNRDIYFDSYFLGYEKNSSYIVDNKEKVMYKYNVKKNKLEIKKAKVLSNGIWENRNINTLISTREQFTYKTDYHYNLENNNIYLTYRDSNIKRLIEKDITNIIRVKDQDIFYLKGDTLYHYSDKTGPEKLITYFEWNFNNFNNIYIN